MNPSTRSGMKFPIDLVYLDRNKKVKKVRSGVPPWRLSACLSASSVLELASGTVHTTQTQPGDWLEFSPALPVGDPQISPDAVVNAGPEPGNKQGVAMLMQSKKLRAISEFLVVAICTAAFAFTTIGICASVLVRTATPQGHATSFNIGLPDINSSITRTHTMSLQFFLWNTPLDTHPVYQLSSCPTLQQLFRWWLLSVCSDPKVVNYSGWHSCLPASSRRCE